MSGTTCPIRCSQHSVDIHFCGVMTAIQAAARDQMPQAAQTDTVESGPVSELTARSDQIGSI
jgi:hypothetical protein